MQRAVPQQHGTTVELVYFSSKTWFIIETRPINIAGRRLCIDPDDVRLRLAAEKQMRGAVVKDGANESHRSLVVGRGQRADGEIRLAGQELHDMDEQGYGADLLDPDPRRGGGSKGEVQWGCETFAYQDV